jgi:type IV pilus assembly protein PilA
MRSQFQVKTIQYTLKSQNYCRRFSHGFTLIELLVVIIIIGILAAISLPAFLNQVSKARQSEAKAYLASMNRAQQAYLIEKRQFANNLQLQFLSIGISPTTANYTYTISGGGLGATSVTNQAQPLSRVLKAYLGGVSISNAPGITNDATALSALCEALLSPENFGGDGTEVLVFSPSSVPACPTGGTTGYIAIN